MGQKVNPIGFRIGELYGWKSRWFAENKFKNFLAEDIKLRRALMDKLKLAGITDVQIERLPRSMTIIVSVTRPGVVIGRGGTGLEDLKKFIIKTLGIRDEKQAPKIDLKVEEVREPELSAHLVASRIVAELERRLPARRVVNRTMERVMASGAKGVKIVLSGRVGGAEISRREKYHLGSVPTQTIRAEIDYAQVPALLKKGYVGVKVWIHKKRQNVAT